MSLLVILTYVGFGLVVVAVAAALIAILLRLRTILFTLGTVNVGLRAIARRVEPLEPVLAEVNRDLTGVRDALRAVLAAKQRQRQERELV